VVEGTWISGESPHPPGELRSGHCGAALGVGRRVRLLERSPDRLAQPPAADGAGGVGVPIEHRVVGASGGVLPPRLAGGECDLCDARREVERSHGVSTQLERLERGACGRQLLLEDPGGVLDVAPVTGRGGQPTERQLDLGVGIGALVATGPERGEEMVGSANRDAQQAI
jgi:hypothetical protein